MTLAHLTLHLMSSQAAPVPVGADAVPLLMSALTLREDGEDTRAPEWVHLLPAGTDGQIGTDDKRGPYHVGDLEAIIHASMRDGDKLPIDENHATDLAAPLGNPAPARGWIVEMQARADGIWGRVEWTNRGAALVASKAYRGISPVIMADTGKKIASILRASLVNKPNLLGMATLHQSQDTAMNFRDKLVEMLGLAATASDDEIMTALTKKVKGAADAPAMQSAVTDMTALLGLPEGTGPDALVAAVKTLHASGSDDTKDGLIVELQASVTAMATELKALKDGQSASASEDFYKSALAEKRAGVGPASKAHLISLHQADPVAAVAFVNAMPRLGDTATTLQPPAPKEGEVHLNAAQKAVAAQLGMSEADYAKELEAIEQEAS